MRIRTDITIDAAPDLVFRLATDVARWPQLIPAITRIEMLTPGPVRIGTVFRETRVMFGRDATEQMKVAELEPPRRFALTATNHGTSYVALHEFEHAGAGTHVTLTFEGHPVSVGAWLCLPFGWLMKGTVRAMLAADLAALKVACETEPAA